MNSRVRHYCTATRIAAGDVPPPPAPGAAQSRCSSPWRELLHAELLVRVVRKWLDLGLRVLSITEESQDLWQTRLSRSSGDWSGLQVFFGLGVDPEELRARAASGAEDAVVLAAARNLLQLKDETDNSEIARKVNPWIADARAAAKTFLAAHHDRKGGGEHGEGISGGHAFLGAFDVGIELLWTNSSQPRRRTIRTYSRIVTPSEFVYEMDDSKCRPPPSRSRVQWRCLFARSGRNASASNLSNQTSQRPHPDASCAHA